ncbi:hypothetical protein F7P73_14835 [Acinetobacter bohemicus]|uniref:Uncharacterized protein n=1 Tax=Acinetobacter bohemicus TaxID=1435036 RepID=A0A1I6VVI6_9GAMM|nr:hypothetical protein [Acinetobacter bohemicus]KAB0650992.1 hypothetical protein F7P73_14835 [Acinetobacter bohemicus]SFT17611.1 hypothetical protein SAMN05444586_103334 [Acinetobacter bohemicus]
MKILNGNEAFAAIAAGQNIECRLIHQDHGFQDIKQFTATVYFDPRYEFRVAIKFFTIGEMQVPEAIQEAPAKGVQCFAPSILTEELSKSFKWKSSNSDLMLMERGQVHLIQEHAEIHAQALIKISLGSFENAQNSTSNDVVEKTFDSQSNIQITEQGPVTEVEESLVEEFVETDAVKLVEKFTTEINAAESVDAESTEDPVQLSQSMKMEYMVALTGATQLDAIAGLENEVNKDSRLLDNHKSILNTYIKTRRRVINEESKPTEIAEQAEPVHEHQEHLEILLNDIALAKTPAEANAQLKYTKSWTPEQRTPVIQAINKRLVQLNPIAEIKIEETPSLMVQIQNAPDLTALDVLEIDVGSRHPDIQSKLMGYVKKRRFELENGAGPVGAPL